MRNLMSPDELMCLLLAMLLSVTLVGLCCKKKPEKTRRSKMTPLDKKTQEQLDRMIAYMEKDAQDKADEIEQQAQEEAAAEKQRIVKLQQDKQTAHYEKELARMKTEYKRAKNEARQQSNLDLQKYRYELVQSLKADVRAEVVQMLADPQTYKEFMHGSVREAIYRLLQPTIVVRCRDADRHILEGFATEIEGTEVIIANNDPLPEDCLGGILAASTDGKLWVDCTVEERIELVLHKEEPNTRHNLFAPDEETEPTPDPTEHIYDKELDPEVEDHSTIGMHSNPSFIRGKDS